MDSGRNSISFQNILLMDGNKILSADILDIIFEGRNKEYGAYDLRKTYNSRLVKSLLATAAFCALLFTGYLMANKLSAKTSRLLTANDVFLDKIPVEEPKNEPPPLPPPKQVEPPKQSITQYTPPKIVPDNDVKEDEKPPEMRELEDTKIGAINQDGVKDDGLIAPPVAETKGVIEAPKRNDEDENKTWLSVQIESSYPDGDAAWRRYLGKNLRYPQEALDSEIHGTVLVQFIVDKEGNVSSVEAVSGPKELHEEAVRVIKKSGKWIPGIQNGNPVKSYKKQPIVFRMVTE